MGSYPTMFSVLEKPSSPGNTRKKITAMKELHIRLMVNAFITFGSFMIKKFRANSR